MLWPSIYNLYNNFVNNQYLNLKFNDYIRRSAVQTILHLNVMKYLLLRTLFIKIVVQLHNSSKKNRNGNVVPHTKLNLKN